MSDPPPSSIPSVPESPLFHHVDGQRILVFVEAGGILNRPKLIRDLKKHDAVICTDPKNAQIILVNAESWQGKEFIREWGKDQNKVVLGYHWVTKSISAGRVLLANDDWGGHRTRDDGLPIVRPSAIGDGDDGAPGSPLPTPRITPMEANVALKKTRKTSYTSSEQQSNGILPSRLITNLPPTESIQASSITPHLALYTPNLPQQTQPQSQLTPTLSLATSSTFAQQQQAPPTLPFGMSNGVAPGLNMPLNMMPFGPQMLALLSQQQQQSPTSPMNTQPTALMPQMQENFTTALMDIMKMYGAMPGSTAMGQWPTFSNVAAIQQQTSPSVGTATVIQNGSSAANFDGRAAVLPNSSLPVSEPPSPTILSPSIKRKRSSDGNSDSDDSSLETDDGDDEDEPPLATIYKKNKSMGDKQMAKRTVNPEERKVKRSFIVPQRSPYSQPSKPTSSGNQSKKLFVHSDGKPMQFFVQVDQNNRQEVTRAIKKHGGLITSQIPGADYAVLYTLSTTFKSLLNDATVSETPAVTHHFVLDAINQNGIPEDFDNYLFGAPRNAAKRRSYGSAAEAEKKRLEKNAKQAQRSKQMTEMKYNYVARSATPESRTSASIVGSTSSSTVKKPILAAPSSQASKDKGKAKELGRTSPSTSTPSAKKRKPSAGSTVMGSTSTPVSPGKDKKSTSGYYPREKTPPLPTRPVRHRMGYPYTQEEKEWAEKYLFILYKRDPNMSHTGVSNALHRHFPHHTARSWATFLTTGFKSQFEGAKKRGGISHRKEKSWWESEQRKQAQDQEMGNAKVKEETKEIGTGEKDQLKEWTMEIKSEDEAMDDSETLEDATGKKGKEGHPPSSSSSMQVDGPSQVTQPARTKLENNQEISEDKKTLTSEEEDINTVVQFFLGGGDQGEDESLVWAKLGQQTSCKSASNWAEFFARHDDVVVERYQKLLEQKNS